MKTGISHLNLLNILPKLTCMFYQIFVICWSWFFNVYIPTTWTVMKKSIEIFAMGMILIHWSRVTHICVNNRNIIGSDNDWSPGRRPALISTNAWIFLIWTPTTNFSEILIESHTSSFKKVHFKISSGKWRPFCPGLNVLKNIGTLSCEKQNKIYATTLSLKKTWNIYIYIYVWIYG